MNISHRDQLLVSGCRNAIFRFRNMSLMCIKTTTALAKPRIAFKWRHILKWFVWKSENSLWKIRDCLSIEGRPPASRIHRHVFCSRDLDLDYYLTWTFTSRFSKVRALQIDIQTYRCDRKQYHAPFAGGKMAKHRPTQRAKNNCNAFSQEILPVLVLLRHSSQHCPLVYSLPILSVRRVANPKPF